MRGCDKVPRLMQCSISVKLKALKPDSRTSPTVWFQIIIWRSAMSTHDMVATVEDGLKISFKQFFLDLWLKFKRVFKSIERSLDKTYETEMRGW